MKAKLTTKNHTVWVEPVEGQSLEELVKKVKQIYTKRGLTNGIVTVYDKEEIYKQRK